MRSACGLWLLLLGRAALAANWAQTSGTKDQNIVTVPESGWEERWGLAVVAFDYSAEEAAATGQDPRLILMGGDYQTTGTHGSSYLNDVWISDGASWETVASVTADNIYGEKLAKIMSRMEWAVTNVGAVPPTGVTYDEWLRCATAEWAPDGGPGNCNDGTSTYGRYVADHIWSPRRNHAAVVFNGKIMVLGGRARDLSDLPPEEAVGGIVGPRLEDFWREKTRLMNDVWISEDEGRSWTMQSPGCVEPQSNLLWWGNERDGYQGTEATQCETDNDCWGTASCVFNPVSAHGSCVCDMWSARERHAVAVFQDYVYVVGGFAAAHGQSCGPYACGDGVTSGYRAYMNDVWFSTDGKLWSSLQLEADFLGRGEHALVVFNDMLWMFGGRTSTSDGEVAYASDVWYSYDGDNWIRATSEAEWPARGNHVAVATETAIVLFGGETDSSVVAVEAGDDDGSGSAAAGDDDGSEEDAEVEKVLLSDSWSWSAVGSAAWIEDFGVNSSARGYIHADSPLEHMGTLKEHEIALLNAEGVETVTDFANVDKYLILKMRGHDFDGNVPIVGFEDVCDHYYLAMALVAKCQTEAPSFDGQSQTWYNNEPVYGGGDPDADDDADALMDAWDGCSTYPDKDPNVPGLGEVTQVASVRNPVREEQMLPCRWVPQPRAYHAGVYFGSRFYILGGKRSDTDFADDSWYRDDTKPTTRFTLTPRDHTSDAMFKFTADEDGCIFEYSVWDTRENLVVRRWAKAKHYVYVEHWMPGEGEFALYLRAIDPAGNVDDEFEEGRNKHTWYFIPKPPVLLIVLLSCGSFLLCIVGGLQWRHRRKKAAMERYAIKRMRRRFKGIQKDVAKKEVDWKKYYEEHKNDAVDTDETGDAMTHKNRKRSVVGQGPVKSHQRKKGGGGGKKDSKKGS